MEGIANRIENLRVESGKTDVEVALYLGLSIYEYGDLEAYDNEIIDVISIKTARRLAALYQESLLEFLCPEQEKWPEEQLSWRNMADRTVEVINKEALSVEEAEDQVGWYLKDFLTNPESYFEENPIMFVKDLASFLGIHWLSAIPREISD